MLIHTQRKALLRVSSAYRTVSNIAFQVINGVVPIDLQVQGIKYIHEMEGEINTEQQGK